MRTYFNILVLVFSWVFTHGQSYDGVNGIRDTSYTTHSAFMKHVKKYPFIEVVHPFANLTIDESKEIPYAELGNRQLMLDVFQPVENSNGISIIIIHGGGWRTGNRSQHYPMAQQLASLGYTCFTPEYRLSTEALFPAAVHDVKACIRWVRSHAELFHIDTNKITIAGFSAGGELAAFMGTTGDMPLFEGALGYHTISSAVNAVIDIDGTLSFTHPESGEGDDSKRTSAATNWFGYSKADMLGLWHVASPLTYVSKYTPPTLFLNSSKATMHAGRDDYIEILDQHDIYSQVYEYKDAPHAFCLFHPWFDETILRIDWFLTKIYGE